MLLREIVTDVHQSTIATRRVEADSTDTLTNKTLNSATNDVTANALWDEVGTRVVVNNTPSATGEVLSVSSTDPLQAEWGAGSGVPSGEITVAASGGDHTTITAALAAASSGDVVVVYPGTYAESVTIPDGVTLMGSSAPELVNITSDGSNDCIAIGASATVRNLTITMPGAVNLNGIYCVSAGTVVVDNVRFIGVGNQGFGIQCGGSGDFYISNITHVSGSIGITATLSALLLCSSTGFVDLKGVRCVGGTVYTVVDHVQGDVTLSDVLVTDNYTATDVIYARSSGVLTMTDVVVQGGTLVSNGLHVVSDNVHIVAEGCVLVGADSGLKVGSALTGSGTNLSITSSSLEKLDIPNGYRDACDRFIVSGPNSLDGQYVVDGSLSVGSALNTSRDQMVKVALTGGTVFTDVSSSFDSNPGTAEAFALAVSNDSVYFGNAARKFFHLEVNITVASDGSASDWVWQYWDGGSWADFNVMGTTTSGVRSSVGNEVLQQTGEQHIRFDTAMDGDWATTTVDGDTAYWIRLRATGAITTGPSLDYIRLGQNQTVFRDDGFVDFFGVAQPEFYLPTGHNWFGAAAGASLNLPLSHNVFTAVSPYGRFTDTGGNQEMGFIIAAPARLDTSKPLEMTFSFYQLTSDSGNVVLQIFAVTGIANGVDVFSGNNTEAGEELTYTLIDDTSVVQEVTVSLSIPSTQSGDQIYFFAARRGSLAADNSLSDIVPLNLVVKGRAWTM